LPGETRDSLSFLKDVGHREHGKHGIEPFMLPIRRDETSVFSVFSVANFKARQSWT
jgi:hypothetical protein